MYRNFINKYDLEDDLPPSPTDNSSPRSSREMGSRRLQSKRYQHTDEEENSEEEPKVGEMEDMNISPPASKSIEKIVIPPGAKVHPSPRMMKFTMEDMKLIEKGGDADSEIWDGTMSMSMRSGLPDRSMARLGSPMGVLTTGDLQTVEGSGVGRREEHQEHLIEKTKGEMEHILEGFKINLARGAKQQVPSAQTVQGKQPSKGSGVKMAQISLSPQGNKPAKSVDKSKVTSTSKTTTSNVKTKVVDLGPVQGAGQTQKTTLGIYQQ